MSFEGGYQPCCWRLSRVELKHTKWKCCLVEASINIANALSKPTCRRSERPNEACNKWAICLNEGCTQEARMQSKDAKRRLFALESKEATWGFLPCDFMPTCKRSMFERNFHEGNQHAQMKDVTSSLYWRNHTPKRKVWCRRPKCPDSKEAYRGQKVQIEGC